MNRIWHWIAGSVRLCLTSADPERMLRIMSERASLTDIHWESGLEVTFIVACTDLQGIRGLINREGDRLEVLTYHGFPVIARTCLEYPLICALVAALLAASVWLPGRILFIQVEGNQSVSDAMILDRAQQCGLAFGADRGALRSEQIKNRLLSLLPELSWVGVNTQGCVATVSVRERQKEPELEPLVPGNVVASCDAIVLSVVATAGNAVCSPGDAVKAGQILISGYSDLGLCTHVEAAKGDIFGLTSRAVTAVKPDQVWTRAEERAVVKKYSVIFGKKRINFYSDSGILHTGCGKMTKIRYLRLPGGWTLPVALVTQTYTYADLIQSSLLEPDAQGTLRQISLKVIHQQMTAGRIIHTREQATHDGGLFVLETVCECEEMIGRRRSGILTEGDIHYGGENG